MSKNSCIAPMALTGGLLATIILKAGIDNAGKSSMLFIHDRHDIYMDWFNTAASSCSENAYATENNVYPPALLSMIHAITDCERLGKGVFAFRDSNFAMATVICVLVVIFSFMLTRAIGLRITSNHQAANEIGILSAAWPPLIFSLDRLNTITLAYLVVQTAALFLITFPKAMESECGKTIRWQLVAFDLSLCLALATLKPYLAVPAIAWLLIRDDVSMRTRIAECLAFLFIYMFINNLPFALGLYNGDLQSWVQAFKEFSSVTQQNPSNIWNMNHYSVSLLSQASLIPYYSYSDFIALQELSAPPAVIIIFTAYASQLLLAGYLLFAGAQIINGRKSGFLARGSRRRKSIDCQSLISGLPYQARRLMFMLCVFASLSIFSPNWGLYSAVLWIPVITAGFCLAGCRERRAIGACSVLYFVFSSFSSTAIRTSLLATGFAYFALAFAVSAIMKSVMDFEHPFQHAASTNPGSQ